MAMERFALVPAHRDEVGRSEVEVILGDGDAE
jgi:hypothetical protein